MSNINPTNPIKPVAQSESRKLVSKTHTSPPVQDNPIVKIGAQAKEIASLATEKAKKVEMIKKEIQDGNYVIDPQKVAEAIMRSSYPESYQALVNAGDLVD